MDSKLKLGAPVLIAALLAGWLARADSITVTEVAGVNVPGGSEWTYDLSFINSTLHNGDFVTINDFGPATVLNLPNPGWVFSQAATGPNSLASSDNPGLLNATLTWNGGQVVVSPDPLTTVLQTLKLSSPGAVPGSPLLADYTTIDHVASGVPAIVGTPSRVIGAVATPGAPIGPSVPDGGATAALLGLAWVGLRSFRRSAV